MPAIGGRKRDRARSRRSAAAGLACCPGVSEAPEVQGVGSVARADADEACVATGLTGALGARLKGGGVSRVRRDGAPGAALVADPRLSRPHVRRRSGARLPEARATGAWETGE